MRVLTGRAVQAGRVGIELRRIQCAGLDLILLRLGTYPSGSIRARLVLGCTPFRNKSAGDENEESQDGNDD